MATSVEQRIVQMVFDNAKFQEGVAQTIASMNKLDEAFKKLDSADGLANLQKSLDQLNFAKMGANADAAKGKLNFSDGGKSIDELEQKSSRVSFGGIIRALGNLKSKFTFGKDSQAEFNQAENASRNVRFDGANAAVSRTKDNIRGVGDGANQAFGDVENAAGRVSLSPLTAGTAAATRGFSVLQGAASVALGSIVAQAASSGANMVRSLSLGPITDGFQEYATNLNSIQTILANTQAQGTNLQDVNGALAELNHYSDQTIYNFSEMARNIGTFTAAGVDLKTSTESIKGIANLAALSGSSSEQAASAMYQLSQAIAAGKVNLEDWNSVVNSGMGGKVFQKALFDTGKAMGTITNSPVGQTFAQWEKAGNNFRTSLSATQKAAKSGTSELADAQKEGAKAVANAQESAAEAVEAAQKRVAEAQKGVAQATKQGAEDIKNAVASQKDAVAASAQSVKDAFKQVIEARKRLKEAMKPPSKDELEAASDNLKTAQLDQKDLATAVADAQLEQKRAGDDLAKSQKNLAALQSGGGSAEDIAAAQDAVVDAQRKALDTQDAQERALLQQRAAARGVTEAEKELQETKKQGTKKDQDVKDAQDDLTAALKQYKDTKVQTNKDISDADKRVADVRIASAEREKQAGENLAEAEKQQAKTRKKSAESVADAQENAAKRIKSAQEAIANAKTGGMGPPSWLTSDVLTNTLKQFTGDLTTAELKAKGFNDAQIKAIQATAQTAKQAATEVKTIGALFGVVKESIGSGFAQTFQLIFGNFDEAKKTFTGYSNAIGGVIQKSANARNEVLKQWRGLGGRDVLFDGLQQAIAGIGNVLTPVKNAFREIFPKSTGQSLYDLTVKFRDFAASIRLSPETADKLQRTFAGLFAILGIGKSVVVAIAKAFVGMLSNVGDNAGGFLELTASVGDWLVALNNAIKQGDGLTKFFEGLAKVLSIPLRLLSAISHAIVELFGGFDEGGGQKVSDSFAGVGDSAGQLDHILNKLGDGIDYLQQRMGAGAAKIHDAFGSIIDAIKESFSGANYDDILSGVQTGLFGGLLLLIRKFLQNPFNIDIGGGVFGQIGEVLDQATNSLKAMQNNVNADTLKKIAIAMGLLTASLVALSLIDGDKLRKALTATAVGMGQLLAAMAILTKVTATAGFVKLPLITAAMIGLAAAMDVLSIAVIALGKLDFTELLKGLGAVGVLLTGLTAAAAPLAAVGPGLFTAGAGVTALAVGLRILASAVGAFGKMDLSTIAKGIGSIAAALVVISASITKIPPNMPAIGAGLLLLGVGLNAVALAVRNFGSMNLVSMGKGLAGVAASLIVIGNAIRTIPPGLVVQAAGLTLVAVALNGIALAIRNMGSIKFPEMIKGLAGTAAVLKILGIATKAMTGTLPGAAAILVVAGALTILAPALRLMGSASIGSVAKGLISLGGAMAIFAKTAGAVAPLGASILPLAAALLALGAAIGVASAGIGVLSTGLASLAVAGPAGIGILTKAISSLILLLPQMAVKMAEALVKMISVLGAKAPEFVTGLGQIMSSMLQVIINNAPKMAEAFGAVVQAALKVLVDNSERIVAAGFKLLVDFLSGISNNIGRVTTQVADIIIKFLNALTTKLPELVAAGVKTLVSFLSGIANNMAKVVSAVVNVITAFVGAVANNIKKVFDAGVNLIVKLVEGIGSAITKLVSEGARAIAKFVEGVGNAAADIVRAGVRAATRFIDAIADEIPKLADNVFKAMIRLMNGLATAIRDNDDQVVDAAVNLGSAIVDGLAKGLVGIPKMLVEKLLDPIKGAYKGIKKLLGIHSPSQAFAEIGDNVVAGLALGLRDTGSVAYNSMEKTALGVVDALEKTLKPVPNILDGLVDSNPVITPVLDLSDVGREAQKLGNMGNVIPISMAASYGQAQLISQEKQQADDANNPTDPFNGPTDSLVQFIQNNSSPKALDEPEIYRNTKSQIAQYKQYLEQKKTG